MAVQSGGIVWPASLDFTGGVRMDYIIDEVDAVRKGIDTSKDKQAVLERVQEVFLFRLRSFDLSEIIVRAIGDDRMVVEVPGTENLERIKDELVGAAVLTFRIIPDEPMYTFADIDDIPPEDLDRYFLLEDSEYLVPVSEPHIDANDIEYRGTRVEVAPPTIENPGVREPYIILDLVPESRGKFATFTSEYYNQIMAICLDNRIVSLAKIADYGITHPTIRGEFTKTEAEDLVKILRAGPLPVSLDLISEKMVSPSLGEEAFKSGLTALVIGICFVFLVLTLAYINHLAMLATFVICLFFEGVLIFMCGQIGWLTLNMISISGLIVLLGISVDNLILIFEEFNETVSRESVDQSKAYKARDWFNKYVNAFKGERGIIILANLTTVAVLFPLYFLQGPITDLIIIMILGIGLALLINFWYANRLLSTAGFMHRLDSKSPYNRPLFSAHFNLPALTRPLMLVYFGALIAAAISLGSLGFEKGLDFKGGTEIVLFSDQGMDTDKLRSYAREYFDEQCDVKRAGSGFGAREEFQYIIRVPKTERLAATYPDSVDMAGVNSGTEDNRVAEGFAGFVRDNELIPVRLASVDLLGPTVLALNRDVILKAIIIGLALLLVMVGFAYGASYVLPVISALILDGIIVAGAVSLFRIPLSLPVIAAGLTIIGYSINDSIVICGHIHRKYRKIRDRVETVGVSDLADIIRDPKAYIKATFEPVLVSLSPRVALTSLTTIGVAAFLSIFGKGILRDFGLVITIGVLFGTLSSLSMVVGFLRWNFGRNLKRLYKKALNRRPPSTILRY